MAVLSKLPAKPTGLKVTGRADKSVEVRWEADSEIVLFVLDQRLYRMGNFGWGKPDHSCVHKVNREENGCAKLVPFPDAVPKTEPWVLSLTLKAESQDGVLSDPAEIQLAWDDEQTEEATSTDLYRRNINFEKNQVGPFLQAKRKLKVLLIGGQHHGKSSLANHLDRCFHSDLKRFDQLDQAPAGTDERTMAVKSLKLPVGSNEITFIDTPAFSAMNEETMKRLHTLLSIHTPEGTRRQNLTDNLEQDTWGFSGKPPHAAIVVVSLLHWRDQQDEMQKYLHKMADVFKNASWNTVEFPYVVAATHRDEFLKDVQKEDPMSALQKAVAGIKKFALTDHVYAITNYKRGSLASAAVNEETFDLLGQLVTKAAKQETSSATCFVCFEGLLRVLWCER